MVQCYDSRQSAVSVDNQRTCTSQLKRLHVLPQPHHAVGEEWEWTLGIYASVRPATERQTTMMYAHIRETREQADLTEGAGWSTTVKTDRCMTAPAPGPLTLSTEAAQTAPEDSTTAAGKAQMSPHSAAVALSSGQQAHWSGTKEV